MEIFEYTNELTKVNDVAGGGSAAAMNGAMAASLILKAYNLTKNKDEKLDSKLPSNYYKEVEKIRDYFNDAILEDGKAFAKVLEAFDYPQNNSDEILTRKHMIQEGYKTAMKSPYEMMVNIVKLIDYIFYIKDHATDMAHSELVVAKNQIFACFESARMNVAINLKYIKDKDFVERTKINLIKIEQKYIYGKKKFDSILK